MNKKDLWPKKGKLKKGLIILAVVAVAALGIVLIEEKTGVKLSKKIPMIIAVACVGIWFYQPEKEKSENENISRQKR